jgi:two-component sensor histidine kinase
MLDWREEGGPPPVAPTVQGFGSRIVALGVCGTRQTELSYGLDGLRAIFKAPRSTVTAS